MQSYLAPCSLQRIGIEELQWPKHTRRPILIRGVWHNDPRMVPRVRYTHAADGVSVAYWTLGQGRPLVYLTGGPWSHLELWDIPACQRWYERLAEYRMLVRYDTRGTGLALRDTEDHSLAENVLDLEAVVSCVGLD